MASLADFVDGFRGGYTGVQDSRRRRKLNKAIDYELENMEQSSTMRKSDMERLGYGDLAIDASPFRMPETYGEKFGGWFRGLFSRQQAVDPLDSMDGGGVMPGTYKDGGAVRKMKQMAIPKYEHGGPTRKPVTAQELYAPFYKDVESAARRALPSVAEEIDRQAPIRAENLERLKGATTTEDSGAATTRLLVDEGRSALNRVKGIANDAVGGFADEYRDNLKETIRFTKGMLGAGTTEAKKRDAAIPTQVTPTDAGDGTPYYLQRPEASTAAQPTGTPPDTQTPKAKAAAQPAGPPDEILDMSRVSGVTPKDMPNHGVKDWEDERRYWAASAIAHGNDPHEAMAAVSQRQIRGFSLYAEQAIQMLRNGNPTGAANALYAAYQYFPNGTDVKFGVHRGKDGEAVLVGMGTNEETGEPVGKPIAITADSLSAQVANMSKPGALAAWTLDWQKLEQEIREYNETGKMTAQATARWQDRAGLASIGRANALNIRALNAGTGGRDQTDWDRANTAFTEAAEEERLMDRGENPGKADAMMDMMAQIYTDNEGVQYPTVIRDVRDAFRTDPPDFTELQRKYGQ